MPSGPVAEFLVFFIVFSKVLMVGKVGRAWWGIVLV